MPTYTVTTANIDLTPGQKAAIAKIVTKAHNQHTGAPAYFAQVCFTQTRCGDNFVGGEINSSPLVFVLGLIRSGRTAKAKQAIIEDIIAKTTAILKIDRHDMWAYIQDIDAAQMAEFGRILPEPGEERTWREGLSEGKLGQLRTAGVEI